MDRNLLFREITTLNTPSGSDNEFFSRRDFFIPEDTVSVMRMKYAPVLDKHYKINSNPNYLTDVIFYDLHPEYKGKKLSNADPADLIAKWKDIYQQIVLHYLGRDSASSGVNIDVDSTTEEQIREIISALLMYHKYITDFGSNLIRKNSSTLYPDYTPFDNIREVQDWRSRANDLIYEKLIPIIIEKQGYTNPKNLSYFIEKYKDGLILNIFTSILIYKPAMLPDEETRIKREYKKKLIKLIATGAEIYLNGRKPADIQNGTEKQDSTGENSRSISNPDKPVYTITGKFEYTNTTVSSLPFLGIIVCINQAGNWLEGVMSFVFNPPKKNVGQPKAYYRFYAEMKDWNDHANLIYISGDSNLIRDKFQIKAVNSNTIQIKNSNNNVYFQLDRSNSTPVLMERHLANFTDNLFVKYHQWFPLLTAQERNIKTFFGDFIGYKQILKFEDGRYQKMGALISRSSNVFELLKKRVQGDEDAFEKAENAMEQFFYENFHESDFSLAAYYIRHFLNKKSIKSSDDWQLTLASWMYRFFKINESKHKSRYAPVVRSIIFGNTEDDKTIAGSKALFQYKIEVKVSGIGVGLVIKGGYYRGAMTVKCKQWEKFGVMEDATLEISLWELGGGIGGGMNWEDSFEGVAKSDILWKPGDFIGSYTLGKANAEIGYDISGMLGIMELKSASKMPPMRFGIYSLGSIIASVEPEPEQEMKFGLEVTSSLATGSIWKGGKLPSPSEIIKMGNEITQYGKIYHGEIKAHFKYNSALLMPGALNLLRKMCANELVLLIKPETEINITAHTDRSGSESYNQKLSENRAANVKQAIVDICGNTIKASINAKGKGELYAKSQGVRNNVKSPKYRRVDVTINGILVLRLVE